LFTLSMIIFLIIIEWLNRHRDFVLQDLEKRFKLSLRWLIYLTLLFMIDLYKGNQQEFIYFQF
jgi:hypothetical protein